MDKAETKFSFYDLQRIVLDHDLCCGCGACVGVCPTGALEIDIFRSHKPVLDESKCTTCGLCYEVCPGQGYPAGKWAQQHCNEETRMVSERGPVRKYLRGHSTDPDIRLNSASGGIATSLMLHLLDTHQVDEVVVIGMEYERPIARLTSDPQFVLDSLGSKYGPVPMLATIIPELRKRHRRIAMTVTPCQLGGWTKAIELIPKLRKSKVLSIGLFCGQVQSYDSIMSIAATVGVSYPEEAKFIGWRCGPYPGSARFQKSDATVVEKPLYPCYDVAVPHFSLHRCFLCSDGGNWLADMTLGDIHAAGNDETVIVCRTKQAEDMLQSAQNSGKISIWEMMPEQVEGCVIRKISRSKMLPALAVNTWLKKKGRPVAEFDYDETPPLRGSLKIMDIVWVWKYRLTFWCRTGWQRRFLLKHPYWLEKTGHFLYHFPFTIPGWKALFRARSFIRRYRK